MVSVKLSISVWRLDDAPWGRLSSLLFLLIGPKNPHMVLDLSASV